MNKQLLTMQLITGVIILCEATESTTYYDVFNPIRPVILDGRVAYTRMNPYSDSTETVIKKDHIISVQPLHVAYIDVFNEAVRQTEEQLKQSIQLTTQSEESSDKIVMEAQGTIQ